MTRFVLLKPVTIGCQEYTNDCTGSDQILEPSKVLLCVTKVK